MIKRITAKYSAKSGWFYQLGQYGTATNEFDGADEGVWSAGGVGNHTIWCEIAKVGNALESMTKAKDNQKEIVVPVIALKTVAPGTWPTPRASANQPPGNQQAIPGGPPLPPKK
jgi:hypothetical protein